MDAAVSPPGAAVGAHYAPPTENPEDDDDDEGWGMLCSLTDESELVPADFSPVVFTLQLPAAGVRQFVVKQNGTARLNPVEGLGESETVVTTGAVVWDGSVVMAAALPGLGPEIGLQSTATVLELGAGASGLPGLTALAMGATVTLTDGAAALLLPLREAVMSNCTEVEQARATIAHLRWDNVAGSHHEGAYDVVLAAECVYDVTAVGILLDALDAALTPTGCAVVAIDTKIGRHVAYAEFASRARDRFNVETLAHRDSTHDSETVTIYRLVRPQP
eukprot:m.121741 g.121741  ORF g.121741 m.121741 type:complete len:276 (-) comp21916_c0_seq2:206-1033(-)